MPHFGEDAVADVLLTHSYHLSYDRKQVRKMQPYPPLGTLYAASVLRQNGISVAVFDSMLEEPESGFRKALRAHRPKFVAIYEDDFNFLTKMCLTRMREVAFHMICEARKAGARVIVHGSDATDHAIEYLHQGCEFVLIGEAEHTLLQVIQEIRNNGDGRHVPGVATLQRVGSKEMLQKQSPAPPRQFAGFPLPARDLIEISKYRDVWSAAHGVFSLNLIASRGCPFRCNWCAKPIFGDTFHARPAAEVAEEMRHLKEVYGAEHLWFADDIFALNRHWTRQFAVEVRKRNAAVPFKIQARADLLTSETAQSLGRAGCAEVWMGVESGSQKVLDAMDKGLEVEEVVLRAPTFARRRNPRVLFHPVRISRRELGRRSKDHRSRSRDASRRHRRFFLLPASKYSILRACATATRIEAKLVRQRRPLRDVQGRLHRWLLSSDSRCPSCRSGLMEDASHRP